jgi:hypothetical protein
MLEVNKVLPDKKYRTVRYYFNFFFASSFRQIFMPSPCDKYFILIFIDEDCVLHYLQCFWFTSIVKEVLIQNIKKYGRVFFVSGFRLGYLEVSQHCCKTIIFIDFSPLRDPDLLDPRHLYFLFGSEPTYLMASSSWSIIPWPAAKEKTKTQVRVIETKMNILNIS